MNLFVYSQASFLLSTVVGTSKFSVIWIPPGRLAFFYSSLCVHTYSIFLCLGLSVVSSSSSAFSLPKICCNHLVSAILLILFLIVHVYHFCVYLYITFIESWEREEINIGTLSFILMFFSWNEDKNGLCRSCIYLFIQEILSAC